MQYQLSEKVQRLQSRLDAGVVRQVLLTGHPGTGKTAFSEYYAQHREAEYLYFLCHPWVTDEELFNVLDVAAIAVGIQDKSEAWTHGVLRLAAERSQEGMVVLCLDEIDKVSSKVEALLLDFLQTGRVPTPDHRQIQANQENLVIFLTSNGHRQISDALLRRLYRFEMEFLPASVEQDILRHATGATMPLVKAVVRMASLLRQSEEASKPSLAEMTLLIQCLLCGGEDLQSVSQDVLATLCKSEEDTKVLGKSGNWAAMLHGLVVHARQEAMRRKYIVNA